MDLLHAEFAARSFRHGNRIISIDGGGRPTGIHHRVSPSSEVQSGQDGFKLTFRLCRAGPLARDLPDHSHASPLTILFRKIAPIHRDPIVPGFRTLERRRAMRDIIFIQRPISEPKKDQIVDLLFFDDHAPEDHDFFPVSIRFEASIVSVTPGSAWWTYRLGNVEEQADNTHVTPMTVVKRRTALSTIACTTRMMYLTFRYAASLT